MISISESTIFNLFNVLKSELLKQFSQKCLKNTKVVQVFEVFEEQKTVEKFTD